MDLLTVFTVASLACTYLTRVLLLEKKISHEGPFVLNETFILFQDNNHVQRFAFFDIIRFICGAYKRVPDMPQRVYTLRDTWLAEIWTCHICLSFWTAIPVSLLIVYLYQVSFSHFSILHFGIACVSALLNDLVRSR